MLLPGAPVKKEPAWDTDMCDVSEATRVDPSSGQQVKKKRVQDPVPTRKQLEISSDRKPKRSTRKLIKSKDTCVKKEVVDPKEVFEVSNELVQQSGVVSPPAKRRKISGAAHPKGSPREAKKSKISRIKREPELDPKVTSDGQMEHDDLNSQLEEQPKEKSTASKKENIRSTAHAKRIAHEVIKCENPDESGINDRFDERSKGVSLETELEGLYAGHELKDEVVVGPLTLQHPDVVYAVIRTNAQRSNSSSLAPGQICSVKLEQISVNTERSECRVGQNTYKIRPCGLAGQSIRDKIDNLFESDESSDTGASSGDHDNNSCEDEFDDLESDPPNYNPIPHSKRKKRRHNPPYKCELCDRVYKKKYIFLKRHIKDTHMTNGVFKCKECGHETSRLKAFREHQMVHTGEKPYKCSLCSYACINKISFETHERDHAGEKRYECNDCDFKTQYRQSIYQHLLVHTDEKPFKCDQCDYVAKSLRNLTRHKTSHFGVKRFKCQCCSFSSSWKTELRKHQATHRNEEKPYRCSRCDYRGAKKHYLKKHFLRHNAPKNIKCDKCDYKTHDIYCLHIHQRVHSDDKPFKCPLCDFRTKHASTIRIHQKAHTSSEKPYKCSECDYECRRQGNLQRHQMRHTGEKPFKCDQCSFRCSMKRNLQRHQLTHTNSKPFACDQCDYRGNNESNLKSHKIGHTGEKRFKCTECDYASRSKCCLDIHLMKHAGEKPFACDLCDYRTYSKLYFDVHFKMHIGRKPFKCDHCGRAFITKSALSRHMLTHTGQKVYNYKCSECSYKCMRQESLANHEKRHRTKTKS